MTDAERTICKMYLEDLDKTHSCNEYHLLMDMVNHSTNGHWVKMPLVKAGQTYSHKCSVCGRVIYVDAEEDLEDYPYCHCGAKMTREETEQVIDLSKPNSHLHEPLFPGLSWTAKDFDILGMYLGEELISYIEDKDGPFEDNCMNRLLEMKDECSEIYAASAFAKELSERLKLRKELRENRKDVVK